MNKRYIFVRYNIRSGKSFSYTSPMYMSSIVASKAMCDDVDDHVAGDSRLAITWPSDNKNPPTWAEFLHPEDTAFTRWDIHTLIDDRSVEETVLDDKTQGEWDRWLEHHGIPPVVAEVIHASAVAALLEWHNETHEFDGVHAEDGDMKMYKGWEIFLWRDRLRERDVWCARQHGVTMNNISEEAIKNMIDHKEQQRRDAR